MAKYIGNGSQPHISPKIIEKNLRNQWYVPVGYRFSDIKSNITTVEQMRNNLEKIKKAEIPYYKLSKFQDHNLDIVDESNFENGRFKKVSKNEKMLKYHKVKLQELRTQPGYIKGAKLFKKCLVDNKKRLPNFLEYEEDS